MSLLVCVSRRHAYISACITLRFHVRPHSNTRKVFACFLIHAAFPNQGSYTKTNFSDTALPVSPVPAALLYHASV